MEEDVAKRSIISNGVNDGKTSAESRTNANADGGCEEPAAHHACGGEASDVLKRFDEDALPVPLEEVETLTGGVDENDDRTVEFPWDEEARRNRLAPRPIKFEGEECPQEVFSRFLVAIK